MASPFNSGIALLQLWMFFLLNSTITMAFVTTTQVYGFSTTTTTTFAHCSSSKQRFVYQQYQQQQRMHHLQHSNNHFRQPASSSVVLQLYDASDGSSSLPSVPIVVGCAVVLFVAAQSWINSMASGDDGLGAYLQDGSGFQGSNFRLKSKNLRGATRSRPTAATTTPTTNDDPLPWLKLPRFDFVEVAGQEKEQQQQQALVFELLETLRQEMNFNLQRGDIKEAERLRKELEEMMENNQIKFEPDFE